MDDEKTSWDKATFISCGQKDIYKSILKEKMLTKDGKNIKIMQIVGNSRNRTGGSMPVSIRRSDLLNILVWIFPKKSLSNNLVFLKFSEPQFLHKNQEFSVFWGSLH